MKRAAAILVLVGLALLGFWSVGYAARVTTVAETVSVPGSPGDNCSHGNNTVTCRTDPSTNGQDCQDHGNASGNEDHCTPTTATTQTTHPGTTATTTTEHTTTSGTTTGTTTTITHPTTTETTGTTATTVTHPTTTATTITTDTTVTHPTTTVVTTTPTTTPTTHTTETTASTGTTTTAIVAATTSATTTGSFTPPPQDTGTTDVAATTTAPFVPPPLKHNPTAAQHTTTRELPYTGAYAMPGILLGLFLLTAGVLLAIFSRSKNGGGNDLEWALPLPAASRPEQRSGEPAEYRVIVPGEGEFASLAEAEQPKLDRRWARAGDRWLGAPGRRDEERDRPSIDDPAA